MTSRFLGLLAAIALSVTGAVAQQRTLHVYNWSDYVDPKLLDEFTKETGIKVVYDTYDSNETLEAKLLAGRSGYDIVVPSGTFLQRQIQAGVYSPLDRSRLANAKYLWPEIDTRLAVYDPKNQHSINYMWFTTGIAYDAAKVKARMGDQPMNTWDIIFKPENLRKFADCGVYVLDSPEDLFAIALRYLRINPDSKAPGDIAKASALLQRIRPHVRRFHSSEYINALANGDICLAVGWSGDSFQAKNRAREAGNGINIEYVIPREGTLMSMDNIALPKDARNVEEAYAFIDFLLRPENAARNTIASNFANGVLASKPLIPPEIINNRAIYPDDEVMKVLFTVSPPDRQTQRTITREWTRVKTGK